MTAPKRFPGFAVPTEVRGLVRRGLATPRYFADDTMPGFEAPNGVAIWVDHPLPSRRDPPGPRFLVDVAGGGEALYRGDSVTAAVRTFEAATPRPQAAARPRKARRPKAAARVGVGRRKRNASPEQEQAFLASYQEQVVDGRVPRRQRQGVKLTPELRQRLAVDARTFVGNHEADIAPTAEHPGDTHPFREAAWAFYHRRADPRLNPFAGEFPAAARLAAGADEYGPLLVAYDRRKNELSLVKREGAFVIEGDGADLKVVGGDSDHVYWRGHDLEAATATLMRLEDAGRRRR